MSYSKLKDLKKVDIQVFTEKYYRFLVIGETHYTLEAYEKIKTLFGHESVLWVSLKDLDRNYLSEIGPSYLRDTFDYENEKESSTLVESYFFKDGKFREFGSRSKPQTLLEGESFFSQPGIKRSAETSYEVNDEMFDVKLIDSISKTASEDLISQNNYEITFRDNTKIKCEYLIWGLGIDKLHHFIKNKNDFSPFFSDISAILNKSVFSFRFELKKESQISLDKTYFIPLSLTHDYGHFIGEFYEESETKLRGEFIYLFSKDQVLESDLTKYLRLFKGNLGKIFDIKVSSLSKEYLKIVEDKYYDSLLNLEYFKIENEFKHIWMVGEKAFLSQDFATSMEINERVNLLKFTKRGDLSLDLLDERLLSLK